MVELQLPAGRASLSVLGDEGALMAIAPGHLSLDVLLDQPRLPRCLGQDQNIGTGAAVPGDSGETRFVVVQP
jgi:hypothetical protein